MTAYALVGASEFNRDHFVARDATGAFSGIIAVDGGFASLAEIGRAPDLALGDFDSLGYVPEEVETLAFSTEKDASDMELALEEAVARGAGAVEVYGALGGRLDHTIANLQLLASFAERGLSVCAVGERERIVFLVGPGELRLDIVASERKLATCDADCRKGAEEKAWAVVPEKGIVSVFSLTDASEGVVEEGLKYPLDHATLTNRTSWGLSNELIGAPACIALDSGTLAVFLPL